MRPVDPVTYSEAAHILGVTPSTVRRHVLAGRLTAHRKPYKHRTLSRAEVEGLAKQTYRYRRHIYDPESYWVTNERAAAILGVNRARLNQLAASDLIPFELHASGTPLYRRRQLEVVANAREARWGWASPQPPRPKEDAVSQLLYRT